MTTRLATRLPTMPAASSAGHRTDRPAPHGHGSSLDRSGPVACRIGRHAHQAGRPSPDRWPRPAAVGRKRGRTTCFAARRDRTRDCADRRRRASISRTPSDATLNPGSTSVARHRRGRRTITRDRAAPTTTRPVARSRPTRPQRKGCCAAHDFRPAAAGMSQPARAAAPSGACRATSTPSSQRPSRDGRAGEASGEGGAAIRAVSARPASIAGVSRIRWSESQSNC